MLVTVSILMAAATAALVFTFLRYRNLVKKSDAYKKDVDNRLIFLGISRENFELELDIQKRARWVAEKRYEEVEQVYFEACTKLVGVEEELAKVVNQKKSSEVRTGLIAEQLAPFISGFPYDPKRAHFIAQPVDYVVFDDSGVHFVEVKSGQAKLTEVQRKIKKDIEENRVSFEIFRIGGD